MRLLGREAPPQVYFAAGCQATRLGAGSHQPQLIYSIYVIQITYNALSHSDLRSITTSPVSFILFTDLVVAISQTNTHRLAG